MAHVGGMIESLLAPGRCHAWRASAIDQCCCGFHLRLLVSLASHDICHVSAW